MARSTDQNLPTVYVVDDNEGMRRALDTLLSTVGYKTAVFGRAKEFLASVKGDSPGCLLLDIRMPEMSGLEVQQHLNHMGSKLPIIFITGHADVSMAVQAMKEGAFEFIEKPFRDHDLLDRVNHALERDAQHRSMVARRADILNRIESLTPREKQVMKLVVEGVANKVIAVDLGLSERTVEIHRAKVMEKMGARSIAHLVRLHLTLSDEL
jgi:two-component system response regulator FixJ